MTSILSPIKGRGVVPGMNDLTTLSPYVEHIWYYFMNDMASDCSSFGGGDWIESADDVINARFMRCSKG